MTLLGLRSLLVDYDKRTLYHEGFMKVKLKQQATLILQSLKVLVGMIAKKYRTII